MHGAGEFVGEDLVDQALTSDARKPVKMGRRYRYMKVRLALGARAHMAGVLVGFIDDLERGWLEFRLQLFPDLIGNRHIDPFSMRVGLTIIGV